jgi:hypothetical protein
VFQKAYCARHLVTAKYKVRGRYAWRYNQAVVCEVCQRLEAELERRNRVYAEKLATLKANRETTSGDEYRRIFMEESDARLNMDLARLELGQHKRGHQKAN